MVASPLAERRAAGRNQVQLRLGVKMPRSPGRRDVMPDVTSCGAGDRKRLVQRLRHASRLPELAQYRPGAWRGPRRFPTKCEVRFSLQRWPRPRSTDSERLPSGRSRRSSAPCRGVRAPRRRCGCVSCVRQSERSRPRADDQDVHRLHQAGTHRLLAAQLGHAGAWQACCRATLATASRAPKARPFPRSIYYWDGQITQSQGRQVPHVHEHLVGNGRVQPGLDELRRLPRHQRRKGCWGPTNGKGTCTPTTAHTKGTTSRRSSCRTAPTRSWSARPSPSPSTSRARSTVLGRGVPLRSRPTVSTPEPTRTTTPTSASSRATTANSRSCSATGSSPSRTPFVVRTRCRSRRGPIPRPIARPSTASTRVGPRYRAYPIQPTRGRRIHTSGAAEASTTSCIRDPEIASAGMCIRPTASTTGRTVASAAIRGCTTKIFGYEGSTTYTQWYKMERPGVVLEGGHPTHVTWAVADVDKDNQIPGNSNHGSKVIVLPFDGVAFDAAYGVGGTGGTGGGGGAAGSGGNGGRGGAAGAGGQAGGRHRRSCGWHRRRGGVQRAGGRRRHRRSCGWHRRCDGRYRRLRRRWHWRCESEWWSGRWIGRRNCGLGRSRRRRGDRQPRRLGRGYGWPGRRQFRVRPGQGPRPRQATTRPPVARARYKAVNKQAAAPGCCRSDSSFSLWFAGDAPRRTDGCGKQHRSSR